MLHLLVHKYTGAPLLIISVAFCAGCTQVRAVQGLALCAVCPRTYRYVRTCVYMYIVLYVLCTHSTSYEYIFVTKSCSRGLLLCPRATAIPRSDGAESPLSRFLALYQGVNSTARHSLRTARQLFAIENFFRPLPCE